MTLPETDYVAEEVHLALRLYKENPGDPTILPIIPHLYTYDMENNRHARTEGKQE